MYIELNLLCGAVVVYLRDELVSRPEWCSLTKAGPCAVPVCPLSCVLTATMPRQVKWHQRPC